MKKHIDSEKIINTLKTSLSYSDLISHVQKNEIKMISIMDLDFKNSVFSSNGKFHFPYSVESAFLIIKNCTFFSNSQDLLMSHYFKDALNLHDSSYSLTEANEDYDTFNFEWWDEEIFENSEYTKSQLTQESYFLTLKISNWSYENLVLSATFFYLEYIHAECITKKLLSTNSDNSSVGTSQFNKSFSELKIASSYIALLLLNKIFGKKLFFTLKKTNIFLVYPKIWIYGFCNFIKNYGDNRFFSYEDQDTNYFFIETQKKNVLNFSHIFFYLKAFDFLIPKKLRKLIFLICYNTKSIHLLYYVLKKYLNILDNSLSPERKQYNDFSLNEKLSYKLAQLKEK